MAVSFTLDDLVQLGNERIRTEFNLLPSRPQPPETVKATALKFAARVEWSQVNGIDGYRVAVMTTNNLAAPLRLSPLIEGSTTLEYIYYVGDVVQALQFSVQTYKRSTTGEVLFSEFRYPFVSATTKDAAGAADSAPAASPSAPVAPTQSESSGDPGGVPREDSGPTPD